MLLGYNFDLKFAAGIRLNCLILAEREAMVH